MGFFQRIGSGIIPAVAAYILGGMVNNRFCALLTCLAALLWLPGAARAAGYPLQLDKETYALLSVRLQAATIMAQDQAGAAAGDAARGGAHYDSHLRRVQLLAAGQVTPALSFMLMMEHARYGEYYSRGSGLQTADAWVQLNLSDAFHLMAGAYLPPFSRNLLTPEIYFVSPDRPITENMALESTGMYGKRDRGLCLWGNLGGLQYRVAASKGAKSQVLGDETLRTTWRLHYAFIDAEPLYYYQESYLGKQSLFTIGYSYDKQDKVSVDAAGNPAPYTAWTADLLMEGGNEGNVLTILYAYYSYNRGNAERTGADGFFSQGDGWTLTAAHMSGGGNAVAGTQPYLRYTVWDAHNGAPGAKQKRWALGVNYYLKGHDAKITLDYENAGFENEGPTFDTKGHGIYTIQLQTAF